MSNATIIDTQVSEMKNDEKKIETLSNDTGSEVNEMCGKKINKASNFYVFSEDQSSWSGVMKGDLVKFYLWDKELRDDHVEGTVQKDMYTIKVCRRIDGKLKYIFDVSDNLSVQTVSKSAKIDMLNFMLNIMIKEKACNQPKISSDHVFEIGRIEVIDEMMILVIYSKE